MQFNSRLADDNLAFAGLDTQIDSLEQLSTKSEFVTPQYKTALLLSNYYTENDSTLAVFAGVQNDLQQSFVDSKPIAPQEPISPLAANNPDAIVPPSGDNQIDALLSSYSWDDFSTITYSFMSDSGANSYYGSETVSALSSATINNIRTILETILEPLINVNFVEVADSASSYGQIRYMSSDGPGYAYAYYPYSTDPIAGDVHLSPSYNFSGGPGNYTYKTLIHETGHALGLKHPGNYNAGGGGTSGPYLPFGEDNFSNTVMTYNTDGNNPATAMPFDIKALQYVYGAKAHNATDTYYSFSSVYGYTANGESWGSSTTPMRLAIWDSDGRDTLDFSNLSFDASGYHFDLGQGGINTSQSAYNGTAYYATGDASGNSYLTSTNGTAIAYNTTMENAIGSSSNDTIIGNAANNTLNGSTGNDTLVGGGDDNSGNDTLYGGDGNDQL